MPAITGLDHLVLTVAEIGASLAFYRDVLGMTPVQFTPADGTTRWAVSFGAQKINLHQAASPFVPYAAAPTPGSADLCFLSETPLAKWEDHFARLRVALEDGPVGRTGALGPIRSLYIRDPDGNLIEVANRA